MSRELVNPEGLRVDGRRPLETRKFNARIGVLVKADGSAYLEQGNTKVLAAVYGPQQSNKSSSDILVVELKVASFAQNRRIKVDKRLMEMAQMIKEMFEPIILNQTFQRSEINLFIQILQTDGGILHSACNAACMALIDAGIPMAEYAVCCSAGFADDKAILDLNYIEESQETPTLTLGYLPKSEKIVLLNLESRLHMDQFNQVFELAKEGCIKLAVFLDETIREHARIST